MRKRATLVGRARPVPAVLSFRKNYEATAGFLEQVREGLSSGWQAPQTSPHAGRRRHLLFTNYWDFSKIKMISAPVALVVASHYNLAVHRFGARPYALEYDRWQPDVRASLEQIGFLELCGVNRSQGEEPISDRSGSRLLKLSSGDVADGARVSELLTRLGVDALQDDPRIYEAIVEAITNTCQHAYPRNGTLDALGHSWWMTGFVKNAAKKVLIIVTYDHGISIPVTLATLTNKWPWRERANALVARMIGAAPSVNDTSHDGNWIAAAMEVGRTATMEENRGRACLATSVSSGCVKPARSSSGAAAVNTCTLRGRLPDIALTRRL